MLALPLLHCLEIIALFGNYLRRRSPFMLASAAINSHLEIFLYLEKSVYACFGRYCIIGDYLRRRNPYMLGLLL